MGTAVCDDTARGLLSLRIDGAREAPSKADSRSGTSVSNRSKSGPAGGQGARRLESRPHDCAAFTRQPLVTLVQFAAPPGSPRLG